MNMADRIQYLRKAKGISQEELADKVGVSRQAVSKWESEQSTPDLAKVIIMSDFFGVTTDYILKGIEPVADQEQKSKELTGKVLYIASTAFMVIGLFCAFGGWYEEQKMEAVWGSMIIQAVGAASYFIGKLFAAEKVPLYVQWLNVILIAFMPISMITGIISIFIFKLGRVAPYPIGICHSFIFGIVFLGVLVMSFIFIKKRGQ
ncbi:helix-turn-helix transcriptional regulator [Lachnospiraceae bacterium 45-W7]